MRSKSPTPNKKPQDQPISLLLPEVQIQLKSSSSSFSSIPHPSEWKTHRQFPIELTKKEMYIGHRGNYYIKLHTIQNTDEIQRKIETILDDLRVRHQRRHRHHHHHPYDDQNNELIIECKKGIFHCFLPMMSNTTCPNNQEVGVSMVAFMKYFQKVLDKVQSKKRNNNNKNNHNSHSNVMEDGYEHEYQYTDTSYYNDNKSSFPRTKMTSFGRTIPNKSTSTPKKTSTNSRKRPLSPFQQSQHFEQYPKRTTNKPIKTYSSKNTKLNVMMKQQRAQERDYDRFKSEDNDEQEEEKDIQLEDEDVKLEEEKDDDNGQYDKDDSMYDDHHDDHDDYSRNDNSMVEDENLSNDDDHHYDHHNINQKTKPKKKNNRSTITRSSQTQEKD